MKKLLGLLSAMTLLIAPTSSLVACGAPVHINPGGDDDDTTTSDPTIVLAQLKSEIYSNLVKQYQGSVGVGFTKSLANDDTKDNAWIKPATIKSLFEDDKKNPDKTTNIDLTKKDKDDDSILSDQNKKDISTDVEKAIGVDSLGEAINNIVKGNKWYDSAIAGVPNRQIFRGINVTPVSLGEIIAKDPKPDEDPVKLYQLTAQVSVNYRVNTGATVEDTTSSKINISFTLASEDTLLAFIKWANDTMPQYVYGTKDSPLRMSNDKISEKTLEDGTVVYVPNDPVGGVGTEVPNLHWTNQLSSTYVNFEDKIQGYINGAILEPLQTTLKKILIDPQSYGYDPSKGDMRVDGTGDIKLDSGDNEYVNNFIFGSRTNYSTVNRLNPTSEDNKELTDVYFGDYDDKQMTNDIIDKASEEYVASAQNANGAVDPKSHPANLKEARQKFKEFIKGYGVDDGDFKLNNTDDETDDTLKIGSTNATNAESDEIHLENIYSFGSISYTGVAIQFESLTGTFNLDMRLPWSFSFKEIDVDNKPVKELSRSEDLAGLLEVLLTYRANLRYKFFVDTSDGKHAFSQRYLYYRDPTTGKGDFSKATNDETVTRKDAYLTWNAIARLKKYGLDGLNFGYHTFGHATRTWKSLVGFAQTNAALNLSDAVAKDGGYGDWVNSKGQYNFNFYNEAWFRNSGGFNPMPYKIVDPSGWTDPTKWAVQLNHTTDDFEWWVVPSDLAHFDSAWSQADLKKPMKIFDREPFIPYDYLFDPNALALIDTDYGTTK